MSSLLESQGQKLEQEREIKFCFGTIPLVLIVIYYGFEMVVSFYEFTEHNSIYKLSLFTIFSLIISFISYLAFFILLMLKKYNKTLTLSISLNLISSILCIFNQIIDRGNLLYSFVDLFVWGIIIVFMSSTVGPFFEKFNSFTKKYWLVPTLIIGLKNCLYNIISIKNEYDYQSSKPHKKEYYLSGKWYSYDVSYSFSFFIKEQWRNIFIWIIPTILFVITALLVSRWLINPYSIKQMKSKKQTTYVVENLPSQDISTNIEDDTDEIKKYYELLDSGLITKEEFEAKKRQIFKM